MIRYIAVLTTILLLTVACSGASDTETTQVAVMHLYLHHVSVVGTLSLVHYQ